MKKQTLLLIGAITIMNLASCKKDRVCECTTNGNTVSVTIKEATNRQAKSNCISTTKNVG